MGRVNPQQQQQRPNQQPPPRAPVTNPDTIEHFTHVHPLRLTVLPPPPLGRATCDGCARPCSGPTYVCAPCDFVLDNACAMAARNMLHRAHPGHVLALAVTPRYPDGTFSCDACGEQGSAFSYHCTQCDFDLHVPCARAPDKVRHRSHLHLLDLVLAPPYGAMPFTCDVCGEGGGATLWLYRCAACGFDAHLHCASSEPPVPATPSPQPPQQQRSPPVSAASSHQAPPHAAVVIDPYAEILARNQRELEQMMAFFRAQSEMQNRVTSGILQSYQRPAAFGFPVQGGNGLGGGGSPLFPAPGGNESMEAILQRYGVGGGVPDPGGVGGGGADLSALLGAMNGQGNLGNLANLMGGGGGLDWGSLASLFFS